MNEKISVIIPTYNNELYISRCLDSILNQTYCNIEIIVLNDGSKDNTKDLIRKKYANISKIKYYEHQNIGVSATRNIGIKMASGSFLMFVDGDDWIDKDYVENCYQYLIKNNLDIVKTGYIIDDGKDKQTKVKYFKDSINILNTIDIKNTIIYSTFFNSCFGQLIKKDLVTELQFNDKLICGEDLLFNLNLYNKNPKIGFLSDNYYHYFFNTDSVTKRKDPGLSLKKCNDIIYVLNSLYYFDYDNKLVAKKMFYEVDHYLRRYIVESNSSIKVKANEIENIIKLESVIKSNLILERKRDKKMFSNRKWIMVLLLCRKKIYAYIFLTQLYSKLRRR